MLIDIENAPIAILLMQDEWREVVFSLKDVPDVRTKIANQLLDIIGSEYREELTGG